MTTYAPLAPSSALLIGPHNRFTRNGLMLNDQTTLECYWCTTISGFSSADILTSATQNVEGDGELPDRSFKGGRSMTLGGYIKAGTYPKAMAMGQALLDSLLSNVEMPLTIDVNPLSTIFTQPTVQINCRPIDKPEVQAAVDQTFASGEVRFPFTIPLRASDPTFRSPTQKHATLLPVALNQLGRVYDRSYDLIYATPFDNNWDPVTSSDNIVNAENDGNYIAWPIIRVTGPMTGIVVVNQTTQQTMYFSSVAAGEYIQVDTNPNSNGGVRDQTGQLRGSLLASSSDWMWLQGKLDGNDGSNDVQLYVSSYDTGAQLDIWWNDTWA